MMQRRTHTFKSAFRRAVIAVFASLALVALFSIPASHSQSGAPEAAMSLSVTQGGFCDGADCYAATGESFTIGVSALSFPEDGYVLAATFVDYGNYDPAGSEDGAGAGTCSDGADNGGDRLTDRRDPDCFTLDLTYEEAATVLDEIVWPDASENLALRSERHTGELTHGAATALLPPLPVSYFEGIVVQLQFSCPSTPLEQSIRLLPYGDPLALADGSLLVVPETWDYAIPDADEFTLHCVGKQADPGDTDGDGCTDLTENGSVAAQGGLRSYVNQYDFYDVSGDGYVSFFTDILQVTSRYGLKVGDPGYDPIYDRGPVPPGGDPWDMTAPDGVIDDIDVDGVYAQYQHSCQ